MASLAASYFATYSLSKINAGVQPPLEKAVCALTFLLFWSGYVACSYLRRRVSPTAEALPVVSYYESVKVRLNRMFDEQLSRLIVVTSAEGWSALYENTLLEDITLLKVIGLDCEWIQRAGKRRKVSMLQLTTLNHTVLIRLHLLDRVPTSLHRLMSDRSVLKVGVAVLEDAGKLRADYSLLVQGCVELRHLAFRLKKTWSAGLSLKKLAAELSELDIEKTQELRCGNWESSSLPPSQLAYAARDSQASLAVFMCIAALKHDPSEETRPSEELRPPDWLEPIRCRTGALCQGLIDQPYKSVKKIGKSETVSGSLDQQTGGGLLAPPSSKNVNKSKSSNALRQKVMYSNCFMQAPDGQVLCVCDARKAQWYCDKQLADVVSLPGEDGEDMVIRLRFEPQGRPAGETDFYRSKKENICVVCGADKSFIRKNIVPREYRKHFPEILKSHSSHDVVLLCSDCHQRASVYEQKFKLELAERCGVSYQPGAAPVTMDADMKRVQSAARALNGYRDKLPADKADEYYSSLAEHFGVDDVTDDMIQSACNFSSKDKEEADHGKAVVDYYVSASSIQEFQKAWRVRFLDDMKPQYLGEHWSVDYNHMDYIWAKRLD